MVPCSEASMEVKPVAKQQDNKADTIESILGRSRKNYGSVAIILEGLERVER
jgi:hypothetical protein